MAKGKKKVPTHDADSDIEILEVEPSVTCCTQNPFLSKAFQRNRAEERRPVMKGLQQKRRKKSLREILMLE